MKFLAAIAMSLALTGCYQIVTENQIRKSIVACYQNAGVEEIQSHFTGGVVTTCNNGKQYIVDGKIKPYGHSE